MQPHLKKNEKELKPQKYKEMLQTQGSGDSLWLSMSTRRPFVLPKMRSICNSKWPWAWERWTGKVPFTGAAWPAGTRLRRRGHIQVPLRIHAIPLSI
jgi:hypothetical protein